MDISYINMVLGVFLLALPLYVFYRFQTPLIRSSAIAAVRMVVQMALIGDRKSVV